METYNKPLMELLYEAATVHRACHDPNTVQVSTLISIKTGGCPEDCSYCPQSVHYDTGLEPASVMDVEEVVAAARSARQAGATRFCMGAAWRNPKGRNFERVLDMVRQVRAEGLETCATLGMLDAAQAQALQQAGLDYYNHNLDTSPEFYGEIITTRTYDDRLDTLTHVREAGINVCCGGIVGMGEQRADRVSMLCELANLPAHPGSVPINQLVRVAGTPLEQQPGIDPLEFVRTIAVARILMPRSHVRLSAGRSEMTDEMQALCFLAGANSIFYGEKLLTTGNPDTAGDDALFAKLGLHPAQERALQVRSGEIGAGEVRPGEVGAAQEDGLLVHDDRQPHACGLDIGQAGVQRTGRTGRRTGYVDTHVAGHLTGSEIGCPDRNVGTHRC